MIMYISQIGNGTARMTGERKNTPGYYPTEDVLNLIAKVEAET